MTYGTELIGTNTVTTISYTVTDNGPLDENPVIGEVRDPSGPSIPEESGSSSGGTRLACHDPAASNYSLNGRDSASVCEYDESENTTDDNVSDSRSSLLQQLLGLLQNKLALLLGESDVSAPVVAPSSPVSSTGQASFCPHFTQYMGYGDQDGEVGSLVQINGEYEVVTEIAQLQQTLQDDGYYTGEITGYYGWQTEAAVSAWQSDNAAEVLTPWGISSPTGRFYQSSERWMNELLGCSDTVTLDTGLYIGR